LIKITGTSTFDESFQSPFLCCFTPVHFRNTLC
jgi:hypothetical protein